MFLKFHLASAITILLIKKHIEFSWKLVLYSACYLLACIFFSHLPINMTTSNDSLYIGCKAHVDGIQTSYGYVPSKAAGIAFCVLFGLSMTAHIVQFCWKRTWVYSVFAIGCLGKQSLQIPTWKGCEAHLSS